MKTFWFAALLILSSSLSTAQSNASSFEVQVDLGRDFVQSLGFEPWVWLRSPVCGPCEVYFLTRAPEMQTPKVRAFLDALSDHRAELLRLYKSDPAEYNLLAHMAIGIMGRESKFYQSRRYWMKETFPEAISILKIVAGYWKGQTVSDNSRGPTQIKVIPSKIEKAYGFNETQLDNPEYAALATMGFLIEALGELKRRALNNHLTFVTPETYVDYLPYLYFGSSRALVSGRAQPDRNLYVREMKQHMSFVEIYQRSTNLTQ